MGMDVFRYQIVPIWCDKYVIHSVSLFVHMVAAVVDTLCEMQTYHRLAKHSTFGSATQEFADELAVDWAEHQVSDWNVGGWRLGRRQVLKVVAVFQIFQYLEPMAFTINWPVRRSFGGSS